eukprot:scaffold368_cov258-Pinguiococcus_pyrenoidosus.AAC.38
MIRAVGSTARRIGSAGAARGSWVAVRAMATSGDLPPPAHEHSARIRPAEVGLGETAQHMFDIGGVFTNKPITMGPDATVYERLSATRRVHERMAIVGAAAFRGEQYGCGHDCQREPGGPGHPVAARLRARDVRHLPVIADDEKLTGLLSIKDLIKCSMEQKDSMIKGLSKKALGSLNPE